MDKLTDKLRHDADQIEVEISVELENRIEASLRAAEPAPVAARSPAQRSAWFWWASSLTGAAAALVLLAVFNQETGLPTDSQPTVTPQPVATAALPILELRAESAMLTAPLQKELEDLQSDLKKAELIVKDDIGL